MILFRKIIKVFFILLIEGSFLKFVYLYSLWNKEFLGELILEYLGCYKKWVKFVIKK